MQSVLSFLSDVVWFGVRPPLRLGVLDRMSALALVVLQLVKFFLHSLSLYGFTHGLTAEIMAAYCLTPCVVSIFMRGKQAAINSERRLFLFCHTGWHVAAPVAFAAYIWASLRVAWNSVLLYWETESLCPEGTKIVHDCFHMEAFITEMFMLARGHFFFFSNMKESNEH